MSVSSFDDVPSLVDLFEENKTNTAGKNSMLHTLDMCQHVIGVTFVELSEKFRQKIIADIDDLSQRFESFIPSSDGLLFMWYQRFADAFSICCRMNEKLRKHLLQKYIDAYGAEEQQERIIKECSRDTMGISDYLRCENNVKKLKDAENRLNT